MSKISGFKANTIEPRPAKAVNQTQAPAVVSKAGMFRTDTLIDNASLKGLRESQAPVPLLRKNGVYKNPQIVYREKNGGAVELHHGTVIEGSVDHGGIQPNYVIDLHHPRLENLLRSSRALKENSALDFEDKIVEVVKLVQKELVDGAYDAPAYRELLQENRSKRKNISLGDYLCKGAGVCRENAAVTTLALKAAGIESHYIYGNANQFGHREDHALALATCDQGKQWVVDSYNSNFHGWRLKDLEKSGGPLNTDERLTKLAEDDELSMPLMMKSKPVDLSFETTDYPKYWSPLRVYKARFNPSVKDVMLASDFRVVCTGPRVKRSS